MEYYISKYTSPCFNNSLYVWFGLTELAAIIAVSLNKIPNVIVTIREGARAVNRDLLQVAEVYRVSKSKKFTLFYLPQLYPTL